MANCGKDTEEDYEHDVHTKVCASSDLDHTFAHLLVALEAFHVCCKQYFIYIVFLGIGCGLAL